MTDNPATKMQVNIEDVDLGIQRLADTILEQMREREASQYPNSPVTTTVEVKPGKLYTKINVGPQHNMSGKYMVEHASGIVYGIKGYGQVHKGHIYGTLDTIAEWYWGGYTAVRV